MGVIRNEKMRVAGNFGANDRSFEVHNPYTNQVVGTCPKASVDDIRQAFAVAKAYKPTLSRADRSAILRKTAELLVARRQQIAELITAESGLSLKDTLYEVGRAYDVFHLASGIVIKDDGEIFSCDITPHGKKRRIYTQRDPLLGAIPAIPPSTTPLNRLPLKVPRPIPPTTRMFLRPSEKPPSPALM